MRKPASAIAVHGVLILYTALALFPILLVIMNSFKSTQSDLWITTFISHAVDVLAHWLR